MRKEVTGASMVRASRFYIGIASLTAPLKSTGYPSILRTDTDQPRFALTAFFPITYFFPASVIQHPHSNAAGQQTILNGI
jgi:hypothetical protein